MADDVQIRPGGGSHPYVLTDEVNRPGGATAHIQRVRLDGGSETDAFGLTGADGLATERNGERVLALLEEMNEKLGLLVELMS